MIDARPRLTPGTDDPWRPADADLAGSAWYYPEPDEAVSEVASRVAFCADRIYINVE